MENKDLLLDLVAWIERQPRSYVEVMAAWRTSCPRLPIWEDAVDHGFVAGRQHAVGEIVEITDRGISFLRANGRSLPVS